MDEPIQFDQPDTTGDARALSLYLPRGILAQSGYNPELSVFENDSNESKLHPRASHNQSGSKSNQILGPPSRALSFPKSRQRTGSSSNIFEPGLCKDAIHSTCEILALFRVFAIRCREKAYPH